MGKPTLSSGLSPARRHRCHHRWAAAGATINRQQRDGLYELVRNDLGSVGDLFDVLETEKDYGAAERLGVDFGEGFRLLHDQ